MNAPAKKCSKRYFGYIRVSTVRQGEQGVSLQEQKQSIKLYAGRFGLSVTDWFEDRVTAAKSGRQNFSRMLKQLRAGKADGVVIHKIDRSARNLRDWAELGDLIDQGIEVHFSHESLDMHSRGGRLAADIQAVVAADYVRNLRQETLKGLRGRLRQGILPFSAPIGYLDMGAGKPKEPDPKSAPLVAWTFERYATGDVGLHALRTEANALGLRNRYGRKVSINSLSAILNNPFYAGTIRIKRTGETYSGAHEPIISVTLFERVQHVLQGKRQRRGLRHDFLFRRMFRCKLCGKTLIPERQKSFVYYRCHTKPCATTTVREEAIEAAIAERLSEIEVPEEEVAELESLISQVRNNWQQTQHEQERASNLKIGAVQARLDRLTDAFVDGEIDKASYVDRKNRLVRDLRVLQERSQTVESEARPVISRLDRYLEQAKTARSSYITAIPSEKRMLCAEVTSNLYVERKYVGVELRFPYELFKKHRSFLSSPTNQNAPRMTSEDLINELVAYIIHGDPDE